MNSKSYEKYLKSKHWINIRKKYWINGDRWCYICTACECELHIHHITYENLGKESIYNDLITLCDPCHKMLHDKLKNKVIPNMNLKNAHIILKDIKDKDREIESLNKENIRNIRNIKNELLNKEYLKFYLEIEEMSIK